MIFELASDVLALQGLANPQLSAIQPTIATYKTLLLQPAGNLESDAAGVRNRDRHLTVTQLQSYFNLAVESEAELVVAPEYSVPWDVLENAIRNGVYPASQKLWVLGCESIRYSELMTLQDSLIDVATVIFEPLVANDARFLDPLVYLFSTTELGDNNILKLVLLVQFKTHPMSEKGNYEVDYLQLGTRGYSFGELGSIRLSSIICSDALALSADDARNIYDRSLILHIQLNPSPRHPLYRRYRDHLLEQFGEATEIICLNWAQGVRERHNGQDSVWNDVAGSAWYVKYGSVPGRLDARDEVLSASHVLGFYYTCMPGLKAHALFLNYRAAAYLFNSTKVTHIGQLGIESRLRGPELRQLFRWHPDQSRWIKEALSDDGFITAAEDAGGAKDELVRISSANPFNAERVITLSSGNITEIQTWHAVSELRSCRVESAEVIFRMTFCQDGHQDANEYRTKSLRRCRALWDLLLDHANIPAALEDFKSGFQFDWSSTAPHQNAISREGRRATVVFMGEEMPSSRVSKVAACLAEFLRREIADRDECENAQQRIAVRRQGL
jgi:hypothetical protein